MQTKATLLCLLLLLPTFGTAGNPRPSDSNSPTPADIKAISLKATALYSTGDYLGAAAMNRKGYEHALARGHRAIALRFLNNAGGSWFALSSYRKAMRAFLEARELAAALGDREMTGALSMNISSLYLQLGEVAGAAEAAREGLAALEALPKPKYRAQLLTQVARVKAASATSWGATSWETSTSRASGAMPRSTPFIEAT
jgi:tetratricopeptide (TPR) repeat protein